MHKLFSSPFALIPKRGIVQFNTIWGQFLESPENFSGPKSHSKNCDPLIL